MEAAAKEVVSPARDECEFVVHTKHTCDACFQHPIVGKRYTSSVHANYDLCARCFDTYTGPDISLMEEVLARDKKHSREFVLKLKIDNGGDEQVRRINVSEIWGKSISRLSFQKMMSIASNYTSPGDNADDESALDAFIAKAKATYIDGDGDKITMTSNEELNDSFLQILKKFPVHKPFRITVTVPQDPSKARAMTAGKGTGMTKRIQHRKIQPRQTLPAWMPEAWAKQPMAKEGMTETPPSVRAAQALAALSGRREGGAQAPRVAPQEFENEFFIHARHTCDGCSKSPIIGTRYHATKIPDFDLCGACFAKYEGEDLDFKPEIHARDRRMQQKWLKRQLIHSPKMLGNIAGMWNKSNGDITEFLKKVQESGGSIESATVYTCPRAQAVPSETKKAEDSPPVEKTAEVATAPAKEDEESPPVEKTAEDVEASKEGAESPPAELAAKLATDATGSAEEVQEECPPTPKLETPTVEKAAGSSAGSHDESFLSEADGNGSIAEAIGRTLDVCVKAIEEAMADEMKEIEKLGAEGPKESRQKSSGSKASVEEDVAATAAVAADAFSVASSMVSSMAAGPKESPQKSPVSKTSVDEDVAAAAAVAADAFSVASSMVSSMSDILKKMDDAKKLDDSFVPMQSIDADDATGSTNVPSMVTGATILKSEDGTKDIEIPKVEDVSDGEDEWSVISDDKTQVKHDEDIARAAEMIGSALFDSDIGTETKATKGEDKTDKSVSSVEPISPFVLAKWDTELIQLHELGFLNDRKNVDVLERLEASHVGVGSTEKVTVQNAVEHLLGRSA